MLGRDGPRRPDSARRFRQQAAAGSTAPAVGADASKAKGPVEISFDISKAPAAVQKARQEIIDAATAGDVKKVAALMKASQTNLGPDNANADPESALKDMSGDGDGLEVLSIMLDVLATGYAMSAPALQTRCISGLILPKSRSRS